MVLFLDFFLFHWCVFLPAAVDISKPQITEEETDWVVVKLSSLPEVIQPAQDWPGAGSSARTHAMLGSYVGTCPPLEIFGFVEMSLEETWQVDLLELSEMWNQFLFSFFFSFPWIQVINYQTVLSASLTRYNILFPIQGGRLSFSFYFKESSSNRSVFHIR